MKSSMHTLYLFFLCLIVKHAIAACPLRVICKSTSNCDIREACESEFTKCIKRDGKWHLATSSSLFLLCEHKSEDACEKLLRKADDYRWTPTSSGKTCEVTHIHDVPAKEETSPAKAKSDAKHDDVALYVNPKHPEKSRILGGYVSGGVAGLENFEVGGDEIEWYTFANCGNVDLRDDFPFSTGTIVLVACSHTKSSRYNSKGNNNFNGVQFFKLDRNSGRLSRLNRLKMDIEPSGLTLHNSLKEGNKFYLLTGDITSPDGTFTQYVLSHENNEVRALKVRDIAVTPNAKDWESNEIEGCTADDVNGYFYLAQENTGIWRIDSNPSVSVTRSRKLFAATTKKGGHLEPDIEGLTILYSEDDNGCRTGGGLLISSNQGESTFGVHDLVSELFVGTFRIVSGGADSVHDTDGIDVSQHNAGPDFPLGVFVAHDGGKGGEKLNHKMVSWPDIQSKIALPFSSKRATKWCWGGKISSSPRPNIPDPDPIPAPKPDPAPKCPTPKCPTCDKCKECPDSKTHDCPKSLSESPIMGGAVNLNTKDVSVRGSSILNEAGPRNALDGDFGTTWDCEHAVDEKLTISFANSIKISGIIVFFQRGSLRDFGVEVRNGAKADWILVHEGKMKQSDSILSMGLRGETVTGVRFLLDSSYSGRLISIREVNIFRIVSTTVIPSTPLPPPSKPNEKEEFIIKDQVLSRCLLSTGNFVWFRPCDPNSVHQRWTKSGDGVFRNSDRDQCMERLGWSHDWARIRTTGKCTGKSDQQFDVTPEGYIKSRHDGRCLIRASDQSARMIACDTTT